MGQHLVKAASRFTETEIDDEIVVMNLETGDFFSLTATARDIWKLIDGTRDRDSVLAAMAAQYGANPETIACDVDDFLSELSAAGLVTDG